MKRIFDFLKTAPLLPFCLIWMGADLPKVALTLTQVRSIVIQDNWMGLSEFGPVGRRYTLKPSADGFTGTAVFSLGGGQTVKTRETPISIPKDVIGNFLSLLSSSALARGDYKPLIEHTDDYPNVRIEIDSGNGAVVFASQSQGEFLVPWSATVGQQNYIVNAKNPGEALKLLEPYFKEDVLDQFMKEVRNQSASKRRSSGKDKSPSSR